MMPWLNVSETYINIVIVICSLLSFATLVNLTLGKFKKNNQIFKKINTIIKSWWIIAATILTAGFFGRYGFLIVFLFIIYFILKEFFHGESIAKVKIPLQVLASIFTLLSVYLIFIGNFDLFSALPFLYIICTFPLLLLIKGTIDYLPKLLASYFGVLFVVQCVLYMPALIFVGPKFFGDENKAILVFFIILVLTQANDVFQFIFGKLFGKNKIVPHLSPNKTEAGFLGGIISITIIGALFFNHFLDFNIKLSVTLGLCISIFGILGDLTFSAVKRYFGIKDFSNLLPGHGGVMDRLDSIIFTGPILFHIIKLYTETNL